MRMTIKKIGGLDIIWILFFVCMKILWFFYKRCLYIDRNVEGFKWTRDGLKKSVTILPDHHNSGCVVILTLGFIDLKFLDDNYNQR